jgi:hypothetical protein
LTYSKGGIDRPTLGGYADDGLTAVVTDVQASDNKALPARRAYPIFISSRSLHGVISVLTDPALPILSPYSIIIDPTQVNPGPTIPDLDLRDYPYYDKVLDQIVQYCGEDYAWKVKPGKLLKVEQLGADPAPFNIVDGDGNVWGDLKIEPNRTNYANHVIVRFNEAARAAYAFLRFTGNPGNGETVVIGSTTYTFQTVLTDVAGNVLIGATKEDSLGNLVAAITHAGGGNYAPSTTLNSQVTAYISLAVNVATVRAATVGAAGNSIGLSETSAGIDWFGEGGGALSALHLGADVSLTNVAEYPTTLPANPWDYVVSTETTDAATAAILAQAIHTVRSVVTKLARYQTFRTALRVGMQQTINSAIRFVNANFTIQDIVAQELVDGRVLRSVTAAEGVVAKGSAWRDTVKGWSGKIGGSSVSVGGITITTGGGGGGGGRAYFLGGDGAQWMRSATPTWVPMMGQPDNGATRRGGVELTLDPAVLGTTDGTVTIRLRSRSGTVTARLRNVTDGSTAGTSAVVTNTELQTVTFAVTLATGSKVYRLELLPGTANVDVQGIAYIEF